MALSAQLGERGITPRPSDTTCAVTFESGTLTKSALQTTVKARGADKAKVEGGSRCCQVWLPDFQSPQAGDRPGSDCRSLVAPASMLAQGKNSGGPAVPIHLQSPTIINAGIVLAIRRGRTFRPARVAARAAPHSPTQARNGWRGRGWQRCRHGWQRGRQHYRWFAATGGTGGFFGDGRRAFVGRQRNRRRERESVARRRVACLRQAELQPEERARPAALRPEACFRRVKGDRRRERDRWLGNRRLGERWQRVFHRWQRDGRNQRDWWFGDGRHRRGNHDCGSLRIRMLYPTLASGKEWYAKWDTPARTFTGKDPNDPWFDADHGDASYKVEGHRHPEDHRRRAAHVCPRSGLARPVADVEITMYFQRVADSNIAWGGNGGHGPHQSRNHRSGDGEPM